MVHSRRFHLLMASQCLIASIHLVDSFSITMMTTTRIRQGVKAGGSKNSNSNNRRRKGNKNRRRQKSPSQSQSQQKKRIKVKEVYTEEQLSQMPIGQAIQEASTASQLLSTALRLWLPTDENLPSHLRTQEHHTKKRIKTASLLLQNMGEKIGSASIVRYGHDTEIGSDQSMNDNVVHVRQIWGNSDGNENGFKRAILAASDFGSTIDEDFVNKDEHKNLHIALLGLHSIVGYTLPTLKSRSNSYSNQLLQLDHEIVNTIISWIKRADLLALTSFSLKEAVEVRWAIKGILSRVDLGMDSYDDINSSDRDFTIFERINKSIPNLERRVSKLPFDIIPACVDWDSIAKSPNSGEVDLDCKDEFDSLHSDQHIMSSLLTEVPFQFDTITTRDGSSVKERRSTAWVVANNDIGSLAYSGKLMPPKMLPPTLNVSIVRRAMREVEKGILYEQHQRENTNGHVVHSDRADHLEELQLCREEIGEYFDCALCNHYPDEDSACKFHTDPEHGTYWERLTCVVSAGNDDIRKFAFRPIPNENHWHKYETKTAKSKIKGGATGKSGDDDGIIPAVIPLFPGDVVKMYAECNDLFHHAVYGSSANDNKSDRKKTGNGRISLVFKRAMDRGNGRKGHGRAGGGRRSRRM